MPSLASPAHQQQPLRVAVVGSGLAGLTSAYLLRREGAEVFLLEKSQRLGFHDWSIELEQSPCTPSKPKPPLAYGAEVDRTVLAEDNTGVASSYNLLSESKRRTPTISNRLAPPQHAWTPRSLRVGDTTASNTVAIDVPMRSFQGGYYPLLIALYKHLGLDIAPTHYTFSFSSLSTPSPRIPGSIEPPLPQVSRDAYHTYSGASGASFPTLPVAAFDSPLAFFQAVILLLSAGISYLIMLGVAFLNWHGLLRFLVGKGAEATFRDVVDAVANVLENPSRFLPKTPFGTAFKSFASDMVLPLFSAVGTMTSEDVWGMPAVHMLDYIHAGLGTSHYTLGGGQSARDVAARLAAPLREQGEDHVKTGSAIKAMRYGITDQGKRVIVLTLDGEDELEVDRVVIATQASGARALLSTLEPSLELLAKVDGEMSARAEARRVSTMQRALTEVEYRDTIVVTHTDGLSTLPRSGDVRDINLVQPPEPLDLSSSLATTPCLTPSGSRSDSRSSTVPPSPESESPCPTPRTPATPLAKSGTPYFDPVAHPEAIYTMATHVVLPSKTRGTGYAGVLQTTNPVVPIDPMSLLGVARLERALPLRSAHTLAGFRPQDRVGHEPMVFLAGSYAYPGIPLLEGCVGSARRVVEDIYGLPLATPSLGGVDWTTGKGSLLGRLWRWRLVGRGGYF